MWERSPFFFAQKMTHRAGEWVASAGQRRAGLKGWRVGPL